MGVTIRVTAKITGRNIPNIELATLQPIFSAVPNMPSLSFSKVKAISSLKLSGSFSTTVISAVS